MSITSLSKLMLFDAVATGVGSLVFLPKTETCQSWTGLPSSYLKSLYTGLATYSGILLAGYTLKKSPNSPLGVTLDVAIRDSIPKWLGNFFTGSNLAIAFHVLTKMWTMNMPGGLVQSEIKPLGWALLGSLFFGGAGFAEYSRRIMLQ